jgi:hypothetical protein
VADPKDLIIKISGDTEDFKAKLGDVGSSVDKLGESMRKVAEVAAVAFAGLSAQVYLSIDAFREHEQAVNLVTSALQNQGIYSAELAASYRETAEAIAAKTGVDADAISMAQASGQALLGQKQITKELTQAVVDFAAAQKIDLVSAFDLVAKGVTGNGAMLKRYGITVDESASSQQRLNQITEQLGTRYNGFAETLANSSGSTVKLNQAFHELEESLGKELAPAFDKVVKYLTEFLGYLKDNQTFLEYAAAATAVGVAITGIATAIAGTIFTFTKFIAVAEGVAAALEFVGIAASTAVAGTGLGLLLIIATEIYLNWSTIFPQIKALWAGVVSAFIATGPILREFFDGIIHFDFAKVKKAGEDFANSFKEGYTKSISLGTGEQFGPPAPAKQDSGRKALADKQQAEIDEADRLRAAKLKAQIELVHLMEDGASKELVDLKKQEVAIITELENTKNKELRAALEKRLVENRELEKEAIRVNAAQDDELKNDVLKNNEAYNQLTAEQQKQFLQKNAAELKQGMIVRQNVLQEAAKKEADIQKKANNQFLLDQQKFGTAYAAINKAMHSAIYEGSKSAFGDLAALQESSSNTLKSIGKVAAVANIIIKTAESAMNIYAGFSTIPIIGPALGIAGAAAAVAFGAEQVGKVTSAATGAYVSEGTPGVDDQPFLLAKGETVVPEKNFEEVIGSAAARRAGSNISSGSSDDGAVLAALQSISDKLDNRGGTSIVVNGDAVGDTAFVDSLVKKISDAIEFQNAKVFGVSTGRRLV